MTTWNSFKLGTKLKIISFRLHQHFSSPELHQLFRKWIKLVVADSHYQGYFPAGHVAAYLPLETILPLKSLVKKVLSQWEVNEF